MMDEQEKECYKRRAYWPLTMLLRATEFKHAISKLCVTMTKGDYNPEEQYNKLKDAKAALLVGIAEAEDKTLETIWRESTTSPPTSYDFDQWKAKMERNRNFIRQRERIAERMKQNG